MKGKILSTALFLILTIIMPVLTYGDEQSINDGVTWLSENQNQDGSYGDDEALLLLDTTAVLDTLYSLEQTGTTYMDGITWLNEETPLTTDFISRRMITLYKEGEDITGEVDLLINHKNPEGGFGGDEDAESMVTDTAIALHALKTVDYEDTDILESALDYLTTTQNTDFGWGFEEGDESSVFMTSTVLKTLLLFRDTYNFESEITTAASCLLSTHTPEGGFGTTPEETALYETALATEILIDTAAQAEEILTAITYLQSTQQPDGSRETDPYTTALALRVMTKIKPDPM